MYFFPRPTSFPLAWPISISAQLWPAHQAQPSHLLSSFHLRRPSVNASFLEYASLRRLHLLPLTRRVRLPDFFIHLAQ